MPRPMGREEAVEARASLDRADLEALLEISEAATNHLDLETLLQVVVAKVAEVVPVDRCSAILVDPERDPDRATVIASHDVPDLRRLSIDLARYPEVQAAIATRETVVVENIRTDPLLRDVRHLLEATPISSLVVSPLVVHGDAYGVLFLRLASSRTLSRHEQAFVKAVASTVANSVRNARLHTSVRTKRDELEAAYLDRYRELEEANRQLREANRIKDRLLAICSHDVRAPLNVLLGHARLLLAEAEPAQRRSLAVIERQAERILQLVEGILESARGQGESWQLSFARVDVAACARQVAADLATLGAPKQVEVRALGSDAIWAEVDESALRQVLENLISNAISYAPCGSAVEVEVEEDAVAAGYVRFEVRDRGKGIDPEEIPWVFERYRASPTSQGLGLGLAIARELVELHGGDIWLQPREGGGTTVLFTLPIRARTAAAPGAKLPRLVVMEARGPARAQIRKQLASSYDLFFAASEEEGRERARRILPDAVLIGASVVPDPLACMRHLRQQPGLADVPMIFVVPAEEAAEAGPVEGLARVALDELEAGLASLLGQTEAH